MIDHRWVQKDQFILYFWCIFFLRGFQKKEAPFNRISKKKTNNILFQNLKQMIIVVRKMRKKVASHVPGGLKKIVYV